MLKKEYTKTGRSCKVTFELPANAGARTVHLVGDFNGWNEAAHPLKRHKDGSFSTTISLKPGRAYRFRYWLDGGRWENLWEADAYTRNVFGSEDSIVRV